MEKKEMSFKENVGVAGDELKKAIKDGGTVILIASELKDVESGSAYFAGSQTTATILLASLAHTDKQFRKMLKTALIAAEWKKQMDNKQRIK